MFRSAEKSFEVVLLFHFEDAEIKVETSKERPPDENIDSSLRRARRSTEELGPDCGCRVE